MKSVDMALTLGLTCIPQPHHWGQPRRYCPLIPQLLNWVFGIHRALLGTGWGFARCLFIPIQGRGDPGFCPPLPAVAGTGTDHHHRPPISTSAGNGGQRRAEARVPTTLNRNE